MSRLLSLKTLLSLLLWLGISVARATPPAVGTVIPNTASASLTQLPSGLTVQLSTNTVVLTVAPLEALTLAANQNAPLTAGSSFAFSHTLANTGNVPTSYVLTTAVPASSAFVPGAVQVIEDLNGNGRADPGEPVLATGTAVTLNPGQTVNLLLSGTVPAGAQMGQAAQLSLTAASTLQGASATDTDTITVVSSTAILNNTISSPTSASTPTARITLQATVTNVGSVPAYPVPVTINGISASVFLETIPVPANTAFADAGATTAAAQTLYHVTGAPATAYLTAPPPGAVVDAVAVALPALPAGGALGGFLGVTINANASASISASTAASWSQSSTAGAVTTPGNTLVITLPTQAPTVSFYSTGTYSTPSLLGMAGVPLFIQVSAAACNTNPEVVLSIPVTVVSKVTGDTEILTATETAPNSGLFRIQPDVPTANAATQSVTSGDGILETVSNDTVTASISQCGPVAASAMTALLIDPSGVVFDSHTSAAVAGATATLIDVTGAGNGGNAGGPARVYQADGVTPAPATVVTGADGRYSYLLVPPSTYRILTVPPAGYSFPSKLPPAQQPANRTISPQASYGGAFVVGGASDAPVHFDIPLDPGITGAGLLIQKSADKVTAQVGDAVGYSVQVNNVGGVGLPGTVLLDELPAGFAYLPGSARLDGTPVTDPAGGSGPALRFALGTVAAGTQPTLTYRVRVTIAAQAGTAVNTAQAVSGQLTSNRASASVQIVGGVFDTKAYVIGKVFADCNANGVQDAGEPGIPGVRIYLEDGTYAVTDEAGKYSLYGLIPRMHVAKLDRTTLPAGTSLEVLNHRNALDAGSAFVDLTDGELHKTDFAVSACGADLLNLVAARRAALRRPSEVQQAGALLWSQNPPSSSVDSRSFPASGTISLPGAADTPTGVASAPQTAPLASGMPGITPFATPANAPGAVGDPGGPFAPQAQGLPQALAKSANSEVDPRTAADQAAVNEQDVLRFSNIPEIDERIDAGSLETLLPHLDATVGFVSPGEGQRMAAAQTTVQVKGPMGTHLLLSVNGVAIAETQVGARSSLERTQVLAWTYIGVNLKPGRNVLAVRAVDDFGNERGHAEIAVSAPGDLARIVMEVQGQADADGATAIPVNLFLRDANGMPIVARTLVSLEASLGRWQVPAGSAPQVVRSGPDQILVSGGVARLLLLPPTQPGKAQLSAVAGAAKVIRAVEFTPHLRPMIAAGLVAGTLNLRNLGSAALQPAQSTDVFEREIANVSRSFDGGRDDVGAQSALFLKGKVLGSTLLTLAYDSDKPSDTTLFRDIQPDQFYPVYGDSSAKGFDAQSTGKLYVMVQNGTNYALYGDYTTQSDNPARQLTQYARALNGAREHWQIGSASVDGFASHTSTSQAIVEFRANGTSGPFQLDLHGVANSQQVDIITRDRNQSSVILNDTPLTPFTDYEIEPYTGLLLLKSPVPSVDAGFNPVYIHVSYSVDDGGPEHWVAGADARVKVNAGLTLGATAIHDSDPSNEITLEGVNAVERFDPHTTGILELARSDTDLQGDGAGERLDVTHSGGPLEAHLYGVHTDALFYNPNSLQSAGESEYGLKGSYKIDARDRIVADAVDSANSVSGARQVGGEVKLERVLPDNARLEAGLRHSSENAQSALSAPTLPGLATNSTPVAPITPTAATPEVGYTSARVKLTTPVPDLKGAEVYGLAEQAIDGSDGRELGVGGTYALTGTTKLYAEHDFINSLNGPYTLNPQVSQYSTVAGMTTTLPDQTQLFDEYRIGDSIDGRSSEAAVGLRHLWKLEDGLGLTGSVQRITPLSGTVTDTSSAITLGADYTNHSDVKASAQAQWQQSLASDSWLFTTGVAHKLDDSWTVLERALYSDQAELSGGGGRELGRVQSGVAYRPVSSDVWNALGQVEYKRDFDTTLGPGLALDQQAWIGAGNVNVQPSRGWVIAARYAVEREVDWADGPGVRSFTQLLGARSSWDLAASWDVSVQSYRTWGNGSASTAVGGGVGYLAWKNLWLSLGYNVLGFSAADLAGSSYTQRGFYLHLDFKFDESVLDGGALTNRETARASAGRQP